MNTFPPRCSVRRGRPAAGNTVSDVPRTSITSARIANSCERAKAASGGTRPVLFVPQAFGGEPPHVWRNMALQALVHGAKGLVWYAWNEGREGVGLRQAGRDGQHERDSTLARLLRGERDGGERGGRAGERGQGEARRRMLRHRVEGLREPCQPLAFLLHANILPYLRHLCDMVAR